MGYFPELETLNPIQQDLTFSHPISFQLIQLVIALDEYLYWLYLARNCQLFETPDTFFQLKKEHIRNVLHLFSQIAAISLKKLPKVTIDDYHHQTEAYQQAKKQSEDIDSKKFLETINSGIIAVLKQETLSKVATNEGFLF